MNSEFQPSATLLENLSALARDLSGGALEVLDGRVRTQPASVHRLRTTVKRMRALWELVYPLTGKASAGIADRRLRDTAKLLAGAREAYVLRKTLETLTGRSKDAAGVEAAHEIMAALCPETGPGKGGAVAVDWDLVRAGFEVEAAFWETPSLPADDARIFADGLGRTYRKGRKLAATAYRTGVVEYYHDWRKWAKYLLYQMSWVAVIDRKHFRSTVKNLDTLSSTLGKHHDLSDLRNAVNARPDCVTPRTRDEFLRYLRDYERALEESTRYLHEILYASNPDEFSQNIMERYAAWREAVPAGAAG